MSQTKVQLIAPIGVVTASTLETTGVLTATTFVGDIAGTVTGITSTTDNLNLGIITATSFAGDFTGIGSGLTGTPNIVAGVVTATKFVGNTPGTVSGIADGTNINAGIITATSFVGNLTGNAAGLSTTTAHVNLGIVTATSYHGSGANLDGVSSGPVAQQAVTANSSTTTIDLSSGNLIYMTQSANTTVAFANTEGNTDTVYLVRTKDDNTTERTITWPSGMVWNGGTEPTLYSNDLTVDAQIFKLTTRDNGATWYGVEIYGNAGGYELWAWGTNNYGELGQNDVTYRSSPTQIPGGTWLNVDSAPGVRGGAAVKADGTLWSWGRGNSHGAFGINSTAIGDYSSPVQCPGNSWKEVRVGKYAERTVAAKRYDGTLWVWGVNSNGELGLNDRTARSSPVQLPGTTWNNIGWEGNNSKLITRTDGTLWAIGSNTYGTLGLNQPTGTFYSSPVQIPGTNWNIVTGANNCVMATKTDGTLWSWGYNQKGSLGHNNETKYSSPTQIPGTSWVSARAGDTFTMAVKTDGTLWSWGYNAQGYLGQNTINAGYSSPVQIPGTNWSSDKDKYGTTNSNSFAIKTDGTLWSWGYGAYGALGINVTNPGADRSSPVQIGTDTDWIAVTSGSYHGIALKSS